MAGYLLEHEICVALFAILWIHLLIFYDCQDNRGDYSISIR